MVPNKALVVALRKKAEALGVAMLHGDTVAHFETSDPAHVSLGSGKTSIRSC